MVILNSTDVRKEWSSVVDSVVHDKPSLVKRTRDKIWLSNIAVMSDILDNFKFTATKFVEPDYSVTLSLNEIDIIENGKSEEEARQRLARSIMEYAEEFYNNYSYYSSAPNRKSHIPYIFKVLIYDDIDRLGDNIICQDGKN